MLSHGFAFGIAEAFDPTSQVEVTTTSSVALMWSINFAVTSWIVDRQRPTVSKILEGLGITK